jgi:REP element-mobilizing transposase RayT
MIHFTIRSYKFSKPFVSKPLAMLCCNNLWTSHLEKRTSIHTFCLMPDHLHLCINDLKDKAKIFVDQWKSFITHESWKHEWKGKLWQEGVFTKEAFRDKDELSVVEYILNNPVRAGFIKMWKEWPYWAQPMFNVKGWDDKGEAASGLAHKSP